MSVTIVDVASHAGVAVKTASKVINQDPTVRSYIRARVLASVETLGYQPNLVARGLRRKSLNVISLVMSDLHIPFFGALAEEFTVQLRGAGLIGVFCGNIEQALEFDRGFAPRGSILVAAGKTHVNALHERHPVVTLNAQDAATQEAPDVCIDFASAYTKLAHMVLAQGRRHVGYCCNPIGMRRNRTLKFRHVDAVLAAAGLQATFPADGADHTHRGLVRSLTAQTCTVDAVFCENDETAVRLYCELLENGIRCPDDLLIIGCDGTMQVDGLWTVDVDRAETARTALGLLTEQLDGRTVADQVRVCPRLITPGWEGEGP